MRSQNMRILASLILAALVLAGCQNRPEVRDYIPTQDTDTRIEVPAQKAALLIGYRLIGESTLPENTEGTWIKINAKTGLRSARGMPSFEFRGGVFYSVNTVYRLYLVPPGVYALGWVQHGKATFEPSQFASIESRWNDRRTVVLSDRAAAQANTPVVIAQPDEIVYVGDLVLDFRTPSRLTWWFEDSRAAASAHLARTGLAEKLMTRMMRRADGKPLSNDEGISSQ